MICLAYLLWIQMLHWIPDQVWDEVRKAQENNRDSGFDLINLALLAWSFVIICMVSYPLAICNAAMVAVYNLRASGQASTIGRCLAIATRYTGQMWMFTTLDAWITVNAIVDRLPKKRGRSRTALDELLYYAWKIATMTVVPSLVNGRGFVGAGKDAVTLLKTQPLTAIGLRLGYSAVCWIVAVLSYAGAAGYVAAFGKAGMLSGTHYVYHFYFFMAIPIFIAIGIVSILVRPFFLLSVAKFYADNIDMKLEVVNQPAIELNWRHFLVSWKTMIFLLVLSALFISALFSQELGITAWMYHLAEQG